MRFTLVLPSVLAVFSLRSVAQTQEVSPSDKRFVNKILAIAGSYVGKGEFDNAIATLTDALDAQIHAFVDPSETTPLLVKFAAVYDANKDWHNEAVTLGRLADTWSSIEGPSSSVVAHYLLAQAIAFEKGGDFANADATEQKAIPVLDELYGPGNWAVRNARQRSARWQEKLGITSTPITAMGEASSAPQGYFRAGPGVSSPKLISKLNLVIPNERGMHFSKARYF